MTLSKRGSSKEKMKAARKLEQAKKEKEIVKQISLELVKSKEDENTDTYSH